MTTFEVTRMGSWSSYWIDGKKIMSVAFYDQKGIVVRTDCGWLEKSVYPYEVSSLMLDKKPIRKIKPDFQKLYAEKQPFYAQGKITITECVDHTGYILYLPYITEDWTVTLGNTESGTVRSWYTLYVHNNEGYTIKVHNRNEPIDDNVVFVTRVREIAELFVYNKNNISNISIVDKRDKIIELIKKFPTGETTR